jgi:hypothetical protein
MTRTQWINRLRLSQRKQNDVQRLTLRMTHDDLNELLSLIEKEAETEHRHWQMQVECKKQQRQSRQQVS